MNLSLTDEQIESECVRLYDAPAQMEQTIRPARLGWRQAFAAGAKWYRAQTAASTEPCSCVLKHGSQVGWTHRFDCNWGVGGHGSQTGTIEIGDRRAPSETKPRSPLLGTIASCHHADEHCDCRPASGTANVVDDKGYEHVPECHQRLLRCVCTHGRPPYDEPATGTCGCTDPSQCDNSAGCRVRASGTESTCKCGHTFSEHFQPTPHGPPSCTVCDCPGPASGSDDREYNFTTGAWTERRKGERRASGTEPTCEHVSAYECRDNGCVGPLTASPQPKVLDLAEGALAALDRLELRLYKRADALRAYASWPHDEPSTPILLEEAAAALRGKISQ